VLAGLSSPEARYTISNSETTAADNSATTSPCRLARPSFGDGSVCAFQGTAARDYCFREIAGAASRIIMPGYGHGDVATRAHRALDAANFFLADVRDGLGPYLAIYLLTEQKWDEASIGIVMSIATIAGILAQTPAGALVDATRAKRAVMAAAA